MGDFKLDFVGIGFPRCGTTWISKCIAEHHEISFKNTFCLWGQLGQLLSDASEVK